MAHRIWLLATLLFLFSLSGAYSQVGSGSIRGKLLDKKTGEPIPFTNVAVLKSGRQVSGASSNLEGVFEIKSLEPGEYTLRVTNVQYQKYKQTGVRVNSEQMTRLDPIRLASSSKEIDTFVVKDYKDPIVSSGEGSKTTMTRENIDKMPSRDASGIASQAAGVYQQEGDNDLNMRGARSSGTQYMIDGVKVRGSADLPKSAMEEVTVFSGGLPASYGDATGGVISISTRSFTEEFYGSVEVASSGFKLPNGDGVASNGFEKNQRVVGLDDYGYNLIEGTVSGPLFWKKDTAGEKEEPLLGFFLSGNATHETDPRPTATDVWRIKPSAREELIQDPLRPAGQGTGAFYNADFIEEDAFERVDTRQNVYNTEASLSGKIDVNTGGNTKLTFGGSGSFSKGKESDYRGSLFNYHNNRLQTSYDWRAYGKFSQSFEGGGDDTTSAIKSARYSIMVDYSKNFRKTEDARHKEDFFNYGYVGKFETFRERSYEFKEVNGSMVREHNGFNDTLVRFTPSSKNRALAAVTTQYFNLFDNVEGNYERLDQVRQNNGLLNGDQPQSVYNIWENVGNRNNAGFDYAIQDNTQFRITAKGSADFGDHDVSIGFEYEQRIDRSYSLEPVSLWGRMRQMTNFHLRELDRSDTAITNFGSFQQWDYERKVGDDQFFFDRQLRKKLGMNPDGNEWIDVDALDPSTFNRDMFSAEALLNNGNNLVAYRGFDHTGDKVTDNPSFKDFFNEVDENGNLARSVGPYEPIYMAGYAMDKFVLDDIVFNMGVRVSRFDANQPVLKDKFLFREAKTVREAGDLGPHPSSIAKDAVVYVDDVNDPSQVRGYREDDTWFNAQGAEINDPDALRTASGIAPYLVGDPERTVSPNAFTDYDPQINVMPRISFSFEVTDEALFYAHYDVLTQRPNRGIRIEPVKYLFAESQDRIINNPNLQPEKTIEYEVGFRQKLTKSSGLELSAVYRELRDMVQLTRVSGGYPKPYKTWGNIDFGTVKSFTAQYDLRRTGNLWLKANYTLQFADGTGSSPTTQFRLVNAGQPNLRTIAPFDYDQRHRFTVTADYRFKGKNYRGPRVFDVPVFKKMGVNLESNFGSGTPYSQQVFATPEGTGGGSPTLEGRLNGSRKPWQFRVDAQIDRDIKLRFGGDDENGQSSTADLNVYLRINNLFNNLNVTDVYRKTGDPDDDGYLVSKRFRSEIESKKDSKTFRQLYRKKVNNPFNYGLPRVMRLGATLNF